MLDYKLLSAKKLIAQIDILVMHNDRMDLSTINEIKALIDSKGAALLPDESEVKEITTEKEEFLVNTTRTQRERIVFLEDEIDKLKEKLEKKEKDIEWHKEVTLALAERLNND